VSLFGPGYGECIAIHYGDGHWILCDSCFTDKASNYPAHLKYLEEIGVDIVSDVKCVLISHWHDDHTDGITQVVTSCINAKVIRPILWSKKQFAQAAANLATGGGDVKSGFDEFIRFQTWAKTNRHRLFSASELTEFFKEETQLGTCVGLALSPSSETSERFMIALARQTHQFGSVKRAYRPPTPNETAVASLISVANHSILLGSDLEEPTLATPDPARGWTRVVDLLIGRHSVSDVLKVPHHGSQNGNHEGIWANAVKENCHAILTPFINGLTILPSNPELITRNTPNAFITSSSAIKRITSRSGPAFKSMQFRTDKEGRVSRRPLQEVRSVHGHIRLRAVIEKDKPLLWRCDLLGDAIKLVDYSHGTPERTRE
jgi:hypothetical protein